MEDVLYRDVYKWLDVLVFSDKDEKPYAPSHNSFTVLILEPTLLFVKSSCVDSGDVVQPFMDWVGNERVDINWEISPLSSPVTVSSHHCELNKGIHLID